MYKVLIVDDEYDIRDGLRSIIDWEKSGFIIVGTAEDGVEALEIYEKEKPSLIITDIKMPRMDGLELASRLRNLNRDVKILIISGYSDFSYARKAIKFGINNYILKPVDTDELIKELCVIRESIDQCLNAKRNEEEKKDELRNYFIARLVKGDITVVDAEDKAKQYDLDLCAGYYCVITFILEENNNSQKLFEKGERLIGAFAVRNIMTDILGHFGGGTLFELSERQFGILLSGSGTGTKRSRLQSLVSEILSYIGDYAGLTAYAGIGSIALSAGDIVKSFNDAIEALDMRFYDSSRKHFFFDEVNHTYDIWNFNWHDQGLQQALLDCSRKQVIREIDVLFDEFKRAHFPVNAINQIITGIMLRLAKIISEQGGKHEDIYKLNNMTNVIQSRNIATLKQYVCEICMEGCDEIEKSNSRSSDYSVQDILKYIDQHYNEDINLKKLSGIFFLNAFYIGKLIKKNKGEVFNDYLNKIRIFKAKQFLEETAMPIAEVAEKVGYKYIDHFYRKFKSITGFNPGEYRKNTSNFSNADI